MNTDELEQAIYMAERRVLEIQAKLHRWASDDPHRRFDDLYNLVTDPAFLLVAWDRVRGNKGARTAGVDGETARYIEAVRGVEGFLAELRADLKARTFQPLPARRRAIPKAILTEDGTLADTSAGTPQGGLCAAAHNPPYEQRRVMRSAGLPGLVRAGSAGERCA